MKVALLLIVVAAEELFFGAIAWTSPTTVVIGAGIHRRKSVSRVSNAGDADRAVPARSNGPPVR